MRDHTPPYSEADIRSRFHDRERYESPSPSYLTGPQNEKSQVIRLGGTTAGEQVDMQLSGPTRWVATYIY